MALKDEIGTFCWFSLMTENTDAANTFYTQLFDWKLSGMEIPGQGESTMYNCGDLTFGNPVPLNNAPISSHWISYIAVDNVNTACTRAQSLGGKVCHEAFDIPSVGRTAIIEDPSGAVFHLFTPEDSKSPMNVIGHNTGQICWMELMVDDPRPLISFYSELANWKIADPISVNGSDYYSVEVAGQGVGGIVMRPENVPEIKPQWMPYFMVTDIETYSSKAKELGAQILMNKVDIPETGSFALIKDPTGAHSYLFQSV